jgi:hypothetical protein
MHFGLITDPTDCVDLLNKADITSCLWFQTGPADFSIPIANWWKIALVAKMAKHARKIS